MDRTPAADRGTSSARDRVARGAARATGAILRRTGAGGGSALPGTVLERLSPGFVERRAAAFGDGVVIVSGTNGKTTTASMLRTILRASGIQTAGNESGSNLRRGVASALMEAPATARMAVLEVDEAALPALVRAMRPRALVLTNVFRDQLDRYWETETIARHLADAMDAAPAGCRVIANADDPLLWHRAREHDVVGFGVASLVGAAATGSRADAEPEACPRCGETLSYAGRTIAHLGRARCTACSWASVAPEYEATVVSSSGMSGIVVKIRGHTIHLGIGGVHNAYNAAAALAAAAVLGVSEERAAKALEEFRPRFGRSEEFSAEGHAGWLFLMKNPAGAGVVIREVTEDERVGAVVVAVSDQIADGRDISWIWDVDFERLGAAGLPTVASGRRAADVAVRLKYAGESPVGVDPEPRGALRTAASAAGQGRSIAVLATYTAMLDVRRALTHSRRARLEDVG
ncbi:MAG TPA: MurT ligase domain-containing protein [Actinomycetota bacterium]|nr:MurT ligase domain-containing protein [Actinomycetota bacterium]